MERNKDKYLSDSDIVRIVETYSDMLLRIALNRVKSVPAAEDIVQTVSCAGGPFSRAGSTRRPGSSARR